MPSRELYARLKSAIDALPVVDMHEHLIHPEEDYLRLEADFARFLFWYTVDDLQSAGLQIPGLQEFKDTAGAVFRPLEAAPLTLEEKWRRIRPFWEQIRFTGYSRAARLSMRKLLDVDDLHDRSYAEVSQRLAALMRPGFYRWVLKEVCGFTHVVNDVDGMAAPGAYERMDRDLFDFVARFRHFSYAYLPGGMHFLEQSFQRTIRNINHLLDTMDAQFERWQQEGRRALKIADAYLRDLHYEDSTRDEAERVLRRVFTLRRLHSQYNESLSYAEARPFENFVLHRMLDRAEERGLPVLVHTGIQTHMGNEVANSRATLLTHLFMKYPQVRFILLHAGYPWIKETACLAKQFPNVFLDLTWVHIIVPAGAREGLTHILDMVPVSKIHGFGGDAIAPETIWGALEIARENIALVLAEKVNDRHMTETEALDVAAKLLAGNAKAFLGLE